MCHHPDKTGMMDIETNIKVIIKQILNQKHSRTFNSPASVTQTSPFSAGYTNRTK